jgi:hypothetical protein
METYCNSHGASFILCPYLEATSPQCSLLAPLSGWVDAQGAADELIGWLTSAHTHWASLLMSFAAVHQSNEEYAENEIAKQFKN